MTRSSRPLRHLTYLLAASALHAGPVSAQQGTVLPPIVVQGGAIERPRVSQPKPAAAPAAATDNTPSADVAGVTVDGADGLAAGIPLREIGTSVTVVQGKDLERQQVRKAADAFRGLPGVSVAGTGSAGALTQIRIRGAEGKHTRVVVDGIEMNTTKDAEFDFSNLTTEDIERIEIIRGPMSGLYGSGALGGVINIVTKQPQGPLALSVRTEAGSYGTREVATRLAGGNDRAYISLTHQWRDIGGFNIAPKGSEIDGTWLRSFAFKAGARITETARLDLNLRHVQKTAQYDGFGDVTRPLSTADDSDNVLRERIVTGGGKLSWDSFDGQLTQEIKANRNENVTENLTKPFFGYNVGTTTRSLDTGTRTVIGYAATWRPAISPLYGRHAFTGLTERTDETFRPKSTDTSYGGDGILREKAQQSFAGEWRGVFADRLSLVAGARADNNDSFQDFATWRAAASFDWRETGLRPHASIGTGVKLPGMYDQYGPNATNYRSNPNLRPETSTGGDIGLEWRVLGGLALFDVTYFKSDLVDKISLEGNDGGKYFPINKTGTSTREGVEVSSRFALGPMISLGLAYTYTDARQPNGEAEFRRAPHGGRADLRFAPLDGRATFNMAAVYNGRTPDVAFDSAFKQQTVLLDPYVLLTLAGSYKVQPNVELFARVENALDQRYQEVFGYSTAGVAAYAGVKVTFDDLLGTGRTSR